MTAATASALFLQAVADGPEAFDLFQALRRLEAANPGSPRLGESRQPAHDFIRLGQRPSFAFAPRTISGVAGGDEADGTMPARLESQAFGLFGPAGSLPLHLTEFAFSRQHHHGDATFARFVDMFHHRMTSLFFRAWADAEPTVSHDRPAEDRFGMQLAALGGLGMPAMRDRDAMPDNAKLHFIGRLASHSRHPDGLAAIVGAFFEANVSIEEFVPTWVKLPKDSLCRLAADPASGRLGQSVTVGSSVHVHYHRFRIAIGPVHIAAYRLLLPGGDSVHRLNAIVRNYVGDELTCELAVILHWEDVPAIRLGIAGEIGWTAWLGRRPGRNHADDYNIVCDLVS